MSPEASLRNGTPVYGHAGEGHCILDQCGESRIGITSRRPGTRLGRGSEVTPTAYRSAPFGWRWRFSTPVLVGGRSTVSTTGSLGCHLHARGSAKLGQDVSHVGLDRVPRHVERGGNRGVRVPMGYELDDSQLALGQAVPAARRATTSSSAPLVDSGPPKQGQDPGLVNHGVCVFIGFERLLEVVRRRRKCRQIVPYPDGRVDPLPRLVRRGLKASRSQNPDRRCPADPARSSRARRSWA